MSDAALASRAAGGDDEAFALLYHRNKHHVWRLAYFKLGDPHEAEDALQETFLRAYRALSRLRGGDSARAWLLRSAATSAWTACARASRAGWSSCRTQAASRRSPTTPTSRATSTCGARWPA